MGKVEKTRFERNLTTFVNPAFSAAWKSPHKIVASTSTSTFNLVGKNLQISHQPLKTKMNVKNVKKKKKKKKKKKLIIIKY